MSGHELFWGAGGGGGGVGGDKPFAERLEAMDLCDNAVKEVSVELMEIRRRECACSV